MKNREGYTWIDILRNGEQYFKLGWKGNKHGCPTDSNESAEALMSRQFIHFGINTQMVEVSRFNPAQVSYCCPFRGLLSSLLEGGGSSGSFS